MNLARPLTLAALLLAPAARAELAASARATLLLGSDRVERGGYDTLLHLGVDARTPELAPGLTVEAALSLLVGPAISDHVAGPGFSLADNSSLLRLAWRPAAWAEGEGLALGVMPLHADRIYLGYDFPVVYGFAPLGAQSATTGLDLHFRRGPGYAFAALKTAMVFNEKDHDPHRTWSGLAGGGFDVLGLLRLQAEGSYADLGVNPEPQVLGAAVDAPGLAARAVLHHGPAVGPPTDFARYRRDPAVWEELLRPERYDDGLAGSASGEVLYLVQRGLADPDADGKTAASPSLGWAAELRGRWRTARAFARAWSRPLSLIQAEVPGFPPFVTFPAKTSVGREVAGSLAADFQLPVRLTLGAALEVHRPASFTTQDLLGGNNPPPGLAGRRTVVVYDTNRFAVLPTGSNEVDLIWQYRASLRWDTDPFSLIAEGFVTRDPNWTTFKDDVLGVSQPVFTDPTSEGFFLLAQARF